MTNYQKRQKKLLGKPLGKRENEMWRYMAQGLSGGAIARKMGITLHTVNAMKKNVYAKLGVNNIAAAVSMWYKKKKS